MTKVGARGGVLHLVGGACVEDGVAEARSPLPAPHLTDDSPAAPGAHPPGVERASCPAPSDRPPSASGPSGARRIRPSSSKPEGRGPGEAAPRQRREVDAGREEDRLHGPRIPRIGEAELDLALDGGDEALGPVEIGLDPLADERGSWPGAASSEVASTACSEPRESP